MNLFGLCVCNIKQFTATALCKPGPNVIKLLCLQFTNFCNKLECLFLANFSGLVNIYCSLVRKSVNHGQKSFKRMAPGVQILLVNNRLV